MFPEALGLSFPREERPRTDDIEPGVDLLQRVVASSEQRPVRGPETFLPRESNWGCQKRGWFGSLPTMKFFTVGKVRATCCRMR